MPDGSVLGAVLAGGASRRMGTDKAGLPVEGRSMVERAVSALRPHCHEVVVVSARADTPRGEWRIVTDERPGCGPLAGLEAALAEADRSGYAAVAVLAVDLPLVDADAVGALLDAWRRGSADPEQPTVARPAVAAARAGDPPFEPLCAVYPSGALATATRLLDDGARAARALLEAVGGRSVEGIRGADVNVNRPSDLARAEGRLR